MFENKTEKVFYSVKIVHVLTRTEKKFLRFIFICTLRSWVLEPVRSQKASKMSLRMRETRNQ